MTAPRCEVTLLVPCLVDTFLPQVAAATVRVLRHFGCRVRCPRGQTCCGQPAYNSGFSAQAAWVARRTLERLGGAGWVVSPSASCALMIREHYPRLFASRARLARRAARLAARVVTLGEFLRRQFGADPADLLRVRDPLAVHVPCHGGQIDGSDTLAARLAARGLPVCQPAAQEACCGFGGLFAAEMPQISAAITATRLAELAASGAQRVVCNEAGCTLCLAGAAHRRGLALRFCHVAELLAESLDGAGARA